MSDSFEVIWQFNTARFTVELAVGPEDTDPDDSFQFPEYAEFARSDDPAAWFCARVRVLDSATGAVLGQDYLGGCSYRSFEEFFQGHRGADPLNRNSTAFRAVHGDNASVCEYFPYMVREAIRDARSNVARLRGLQLRSVAP